MDVYKYRDYRALLQAWADQEGERGGRSRLATAAQCSPSWMTRVLNSSVQLTPDQAMGIAQLFHLNESETDYLLLLVDLERAATQPLKKRLQKKIDLLVRQSRAVSSSAKSDASVSDQSVALYYSSWLYSTVHVFCMIKPQTLDEVVKVTGVAPERTSRVMKELREMGLLQVEGTRWSATSRSVHLPSEHSFAPQTHTIWRNRTVQFLSDGHDEGLHYSGVHCLSKKDIMAVHDLLKQNILKCRDLIQDSPSETMGVLCLDWYELR